MTRDLKRMLKIKEVERILVNFIYSKLIFGILRKVLKFVKKEITLVNGW